MVRARSLAFRLTAILGLGWFIFFAVLGAVLWQSTLGLVQQAQTDKAQALAAQLAIVSLDAVLLRDYGTLERYLGDLGGALAYAEIRRADGTLLGQTGRRVSGLPLVRAPMRVRGGPGGGCGRSAGAV